MCLYVMQFAKSPVFVSASLINHLLPTGVMAMDWSAEEEVISQYESRSE